MSKIHVIDGNKYVEVGRRAMVGDKVVLLDEEHNGRTGEVECAYEGGDISVSIGDDIDYFPYAMSYEYCTLEPIEEEAKPTPDVTELLASLARKVVSLEHQLTDAQRNIERMGCELAEADAKVEMLLKDIVMLDERTATQEVEAVTFEKFLDSVADKVAAKLVGDCRKAGER